MKELKLRQKIERWKNSFENFLNDMGRCPKGYSIERKNNNENYEPNNCKWESRKIQNKNKRNNKYIWFRNKKYTLKELMSLWEVNYSWLNSRIFKKKIHIELVLKELILKRNKHKL